MVLYNKDGTVYKLDGPNPLMKSQDFWDNFSTHNMKWNPELHPDLGSKLSINPGKKEQLTQSEMFMEDLENSKDKIEEEISRPAEEVPDKTQEKETQDISSIRKESNVDNDIKKVFVHCLPATVLEKKDSLYGDVTKRIVYREKTSFEAVILGQNDIKIEMWTEAHFDEGSVLYPKNGDKRWWRIQNIYPKMGGFFIVATPSQDHPHFE